MGVPMGFTDSDHRQTADWSLLGPAHVTTSTTTVFTSHEMDHARG